MLSMLDKIVTDILKSFFSRQQFDLVNLIFLRKKGIGVSFKSSSMECQ